MFVFDPLWANINSSKHEIAIGKEKTCVPKSTCNTGKPTCKNLHFLKSGKKRSLYFGGIMGNLD